MGHCVLLQVRPRGKPLITYVALVRFLSSVLLNMPVQIGGLESTTHLREFLLARFHRTDIHFELIMDPLMLLQ